MNDRPIHLDPLAVHRHREGQTVIRVVPVVTGTAVHGRLLETVSVRHADEGDRAYLIVETPLVDELAERDTTIAELEAQLEAAIAELDAAIIENDNLGDQLHAAAAQADKMAVLAQTYREERDESVALAERGSGLRCSYCSGYVDATDNYCRRCGADMNVRSGFVRRDDGTELEMTELEIAELRAELDGWTKWQDSLPDPPPPATIGAAVRGCTIGEEWVEWITWAADYGWRSGHPDGLDAVLDDAEQFHVVCAETTQ